MLDCWELKVKGWDLWGFEFFSFSDYFVSGYRENLVVLSELDVKKMTMEDLTVSSKILAIGVKDFSLPNFGVYAQVYSAQNSGGPFASVTSNSAEKSDVNVVYNTFDTLEDLHNILSTAENFKGYETIRRKRVSSHLTFDEEPSDEVSKPGGKNKQNMPVVLPPLIRHKNNMSALHGGIRHYYSEFSFLTVNSESKNKYSVEPDNYKCNVNNSQGGARLDFIRSRNGYWYLNSTTLKNNFKIAAKDSKQDLIVNGGTAMNRVDVGAVFNQNFACYQTDAAVFNVSDKRNPTHVGISLRNFEVTLGLAGDKTKFGYYTADCVGTFSAGTWMGIIISVVFISILLFGYLMVQSIQTMDRFDDLKQNRL
ncbi:hypothetical protein DINM_021234 [Dirofilaria immitis]|nr:hypothetical protein [Dirofilaria immitis]